jgi:hypothetical protein
MEFDRVSEILHREPFVPVRVRLNDGEKFFIATAHRAIVSEGALMVGWSKDPFAPTQKRKLRIIPVTRVDAIEDIDLKKLKRPRSK